MKRKNRSKANSVKRMQRSIRKFGATDTKVSTLKDLKHSV